MIIPLTNNNANTGIIGKFKIIDFQVSKDLIFMQHPRFIVIANHYSRIYKTGGSFKRGESHWLIDLVSMFSSADKMPYNNLEYGHAPPDNS